MSFAVVLLCGDGCSDTVGFGIIRLYVSVGDCFEFDLRVDVAVRVYVKEIRIPLRGDERYRLVTLDSMSALALYLDRGTTEFLWR